MIIQENCKGINYLSDNVAPDKVVVTDFYLDSIEICSTYVADGFWRLSFVMAKH